VFVYGLHRKLHDRIRFTAQLPFGSRISDKEVSIKAFFTRIFQIPHPRDCRQISGITTTTRTHTDGCPEVHQQFLSSVQCQRQDWSRDEHQRWQFQTLTNSHQHDAAKPILQQGLRGCYAAHLQHFLEICSTFTVR
jgi:hypothetical protein